MFFIPFLYYTKRLYSLGLFFDFVLLTRQLVEICKINLHFDPFGDPLDLV